MKNAATRANQEPFEKYRGIGSPSIASGRKAVGNGFVSCAGDEHRYRQKV
jgi:hypothetical protein